MDNEGLETAMNSSGSDKGVASIFFFFGACKYNPRFAKKRLKEYMRFYSNKVRTVREIIEMNLLLSDDTSDVLYAQALEHFVLRKKEYDSFIGEPILDSAQEISDYVSYLVLNVDISASLMEQTYMRMYKRAENRLKKSF